MNRRLVPPQILRRPEIIARQQSKCYACGSRRREKKSTCGWSILITPIGKAQRGLFVSPTRAGKTILIQKTSVIPDESLVEQSGDHGRSRTHSELCKYSAKVGTDRPGTDLEHARDRLIGVAIRDHPRDLLLSWAEDERVVDVFRVRADERAAYAVDFQVEDDAR